MRCVKCASEVPGQAQFCMKCGTPVTFGRQAPSVTATRPLSQSAAPKAKSKLSSTMIALIPVSLIAVCALGYIGFGKLTNKSGNAPAGGRVTDLNGRANIGTGLVDKNGRVSNSGNLADKTGTREPTPADPVDVIDYLKHVRQTEKARLSLQKRQTASILGWSSKMTANNLTAEMGNNPEVAHQQNYSQFQADVNKMSSEWEELSRQFNSYPKPVPQSCIMLRDRYLDVLGKTSAAVTKVGNSFARAMSGDSANALDTLTAMQGDQSVDQACDKADEELANVSDKWHIHKDFDIRADGGSSNPFGIGK